MATLTKLVLDPSVIVPAGATKDVNVEALDETGAVMAAVAAPTVHTDDSGIATATYLAGVLTVSGVAIGVTRVWIDKSGVVSNKVLVSVPDTTLGPAGHPPR